MRVSTGGGQGSSWILNWEKGEMNQQVEKNTLKGMEQEKNASPYLMGYEKKIRGE